MFYVIDDKILIGILDKKITNNISSFIINLAIKKSYKILIISFDGSSISALNNIVSNQSFIDLEFFTFDDLSFDLLQAVPIHSKVNNIPKEWKLLPILLSTDPVSKYFNYKRDDIVKIVDYDGTLMYRRVW
jgi:hypothetical protein